jgi:hypothetical protein
MTATTKEKEDYKNHFTINTGKWLENRGFNPERIYRALNNEKIELNSAEKKLVSEVLKINSKTGKWYKPIGLEDNLTNPIKITAKKTEQEEITYPEPELVPIPEKEKKLVKNVKEPELVPITMKLKRNESHYEYNTKEQELIKNGTFKYVEDLSRYSGRISNLDLLTDILDKPYGLGWKNLKGFDCTSAVAHYLTGLRGHKTNSESFYFNEKSKELNKERLENITDFPAVLSYRKGNVGHAVLFYGKVNENGKEYYMIAQQGRDRNIGKKTKEENRFKVPGGTIALVSAKEFEKIYSGYKIMEKNDAVALIEKNENRYYAQLEKEKKETT